MGPNLVVRLILKVGFDNIDWFLRFIRRCMESSYSDISSSCLSNGCNQSGSRIIAAKTTKLANETAHLSSRGRLTLAAVGSTALSAPGTDFWSLGTSFAQLGVACGTRTGRPVDFNVNCLS